LKYDIASKVLMERCREEILRRFLGITVLESTILEELPQETVSVKRSDFPILVTNEDGRRQLVLLEIQTRWERQFPLRLLDYRTRHLLKHEVPVTSCVLLLQPSALARERYDDDEVSYCFTLVRIYDLEAKDILDQRVVCLLPFVPLMKNGPELATQADELLYNSALPRSEKADMLTVMTIFSGLISRELPQQLLARRRDLMVESAAYELIKNEGIQQGIQQGIQEGMLQEAREAIFDNLEVRFGSVPGSIAAIVSGISELPVLKALHRKSAAVQSLDEFKATLAKVQD
jgi:hypothetical protein